MDCLVKPLPDHFPPPPFPLGRRPIAARPRADPSQEAPKESFKRGIEGEAQIASQPRRVVKVNFGEVKFVCRFPKTGIAPGRNPMKRAVRLGHGNGRGVGQASDAFRSNEQDSTAGLSCVADWAFWPTDRDYQFGDSFKLLFTLECIALVDQDWLAEPAASGRGF